MANRAPNPKCGARKDDGSTCGASAGAGTPHLGYGSCKHHGGCTPSHLKAAETELARRAVETFGLPRNVPPAQALLDLVALSAGHVAWLKDRIQTSEPDDLVADGEPSAWMKIYQWERRHAADVYAKAIAARIAERQVQLAVDHGRLIADVLRKVLADPELGLTEDQRKAVPAVARRHLSVA